MKFVLLCDFALIMLAITHITAFMAIKNVVFGQGKVVEGQGKVREKSGIFIHQNWWELYVDELFYVFNVICSVQVLSALPYVLHCFVLRFMDSCLVISAWEDA